MNTMKRADELNALDIGKTITLPNGRSEILKMITHTPRKTIVRIRANWNFDLRYNDMVMLDEGS